MGKGPGCRPDSRDPSVRSLQTTEDDNGQLKHRIFFWIGNEAAIDKRGTHGWARRDTSPPAR